MPRFMDDLMKDGWLVCDGNRHVSTAEPDARIAGQGAGVWQAICLAAHCDSRMLLLCGEPPRSGRMARAARECAYAVVCPVVLLARNPRAYPEFANAAVYWAATEEDARELLLEIENDL